MHSLLVGKVTFERPYRLPGESQVEEDAQLIALRRHLLGAVEALEKILQRKGLTKSR
jgi:hypothetical protein